MLADDEATDAVVFGPEGLIAALRPNAVHIALGTLSVALSRRLMEAHAAAEQHYVAAPVFGRPNVALQGRLWIVAAGDDATLEHIRTVLDAIGRGVTIVGNEPPQAHAFKLGGNFMISAMAQTLSEAFVFATAEGINPELFLETMNEALFQSPFYLSYGRVMLHPPEHPGATVLLGEKDIRLFREATQSAGVRLGLAEYLQEQFNSAIRHGLGKSDWAVGQYRMAEQVSKNNTPRRCMSMTSQTATKDLPLRGKVAFITGASSGIGAACAGSFARAGARLLLAARRNDRLQEMVSDLRSAGAEEVHTVALDVRDKKQVQTVIDGLPSSWQAIDILINNAGLSRGLEKVYHGKVDDWEEMIDTNVQGLPYVMRAVVPGMVERGAGHVINLRIIPPGTLHIRTEPCDW